MMAQEIAKRFSLAARCAEMQVGYPDRAIIGDCRRRRRGDAGEPLSPIRIRNYYVSIKRKGGRGQLHQIPLSLARLFICLPSEVASRETPGWFIAAPHQKEQSPG